MINGVSIPVLTTFKFYPADITTGDAINFQNIDNTKLSGQEWAGVYHNIFAQPVCRVWYDLTTGIDFQIQLDTSVLTFADLRAAIVDIDGNIVQALVLDDFFTITGTLHQVVITCNEYHMADGCYQIKIYEDGGDDMYISEYINIADTHEDCYPLEYSNFENDFGLIFTNATAETWKGKMLIPLRMYEPSPEDEKEIYNNDVGVPTTLRSIIKRMYRIETYAVSTWYAEKLKLIFGYSDLTLNKSSINTEGLNIDIIAESDKMEVNGKVQLCDFTDYYLQEDSIDSHTEMITAWTRITVPLNWDSFSSSGKDITEAVHRYAGTVSANTNTVAALNKDILIRFEITDTGVLGFGDNNTLDIPLSATTEVFEIVEGINVMWLNVDIPVTVPLLKCDGSQIDFTADCSIKIVE